MHRRRVVVLSYLVSALIVLYWVAWFAHRSLVATSTAATYTNFEQVFPLADDLIVVWVLLGARARRRRLSAAWAWRTRVNYSLGVSTASIKNDSSALSENRAISFWLLLRSSRIIEVLEFPMLSHIDFGGGPYRNDN